MSIADSLCHLEWQGRKINLIDTPGEPSFQGDAIAALHVVEGALVTVSGVMGVEVQTTRNWAPRRRARPRARHLREHARPRARGLLPRPRAAPGAASGTQCVAVHLPIGAEHELTGIVDLLHMTSVHEPGRRARGQARRDPGRDGRSGRAVPDAAPRLGRRDRRGADGALPRRAGAVAGGGRVRAQERRHARRAVPGHVRRRDEEPRHDRGARPARRGRAVTGQEGLADRGRGRDQRGVRLQDDRRPVRRPDQRLPRAQGHDLLATRRSPTCGRTARSASARSSRSRARSTSPPTSSARATSAPSPSSRT